MWRYVRLLFCCLDLTLKHCCVSGVAGQLRPDLELHAFAKICLNPGKVQKQTSRIVKRTRDIIFGDEYFFDNVQAADLQVGSFDLCFFVVCVEELSELWTL